MAIALLAVPEAAPPSYEDRITLNSVATIRLVLDKASNVDEAVALLKQYNIFFSYGIYVHFLIADRSGNSALISYFDGEVKVTKTDEDFQIASNFIAYSGVNIGFGTCEFERYNRVRQVIEENGGILSEAQVIKLLEEVGGRDARGRNILEWTVVYNLSTLEGVMFANRNTDNLIRFTLN